MNNTVIGIALTLLSTALAALSQIILKKSAGIDYGEKWWRDYLNVRVIIAYFIFFCTTVISVFALKFIPLSLNAVIETSSLIFVPLACRLFLKENISKKRLAGMIIIVIGMVVFSF